MLNPTANLPIVSSMSAMPETRSKPTKASRPTYRGVTLQTLATGSRFTSSEIRRAVEHALEKHAGELKARS